MLNIQPNQKWLTAGDSVVLILSTEAPGEFCVVGVYENDPRSAFRWSADGTPSHDWELSKLVSEAV